MTELSLIWNAMLHIRCHYNELYLRNEYRHIGPVSGQKGSLPKGPRAIDEDIGVCGDLNEVLMGPNMQLGQHYRRSQGRHPLQ